MPRLVQASPSCRAFGLCNTKSNRSSPLVYQNVYQNSNTMASGLAKSLCFFFFSLLSFFDLEIACFSFSNSCLEPQLLLAGFSVTFKRDLNKGSRTSYLLGHFRCSSELPLKKVKKKSMSIFKTVAKKTLQNET